MPLDPDNAEEFVRASTTGPAYYLLRPDGHIGLAGTHFQEDDLRRWFARSGVRLEK